jgi:hypothetical protein
MTARLARRHKTVNCISRTIEIRIAGNVKWRYYVVRERQAPCFICVNVVFEFRRRHGAVVDESIVRQTGLPGFIGVDSAAL